MIPVLIEIGPVKIYSYGLMLGIAFLLGSYVLSLELKRKKLNPGLGSTITIMAVVFGIAGAKLLFLIEEWGTFIEDPIGMAFSPGGLTWYGGFVVAMTVLHFYLRSKKISFLKIWDCLAVALILAYGVGRIGCHLSGDGDYGTPTTLPWGTIYAQGTAKPSYMLQDYFQRNPDARETWHYDSLRVIQAGMDDLGRRYTRFDETTPLHPTPIYELILAVFGFMFLWMLRKRPFPDGKLFMIYLMTASVFRFLIEFLRLNPRMFLGLTEAQLFAIGLSLTGLAGMVILDKTKNSSREATPA
ncbi:MAG: prolipoprotein diacylglyceryl transferase [Bacteroidetes bacterium]|nr:prolipoprotein diacylglyceryl transferase [Bacteroidota bacterium]